MHTLKRKFTTFSNEECGFVKVTHKNVEKTRNFLSQDKNNITPSKRDLYTYESCLFNNTNVLKNLIIQRFESTKQQVNLLDSGCGQGVAIDELLSDPQLDEALGCITGISIHYFKNIKNLLIKHPHRFIYYHGPVQKVLMQISNQYDLIIDVCGAYLYSIDKINILSTFYQALKPLGECYVHHRLIPQLAEKVEYKNHKKAYLINYLSTKFPEIFIKREDAFSMVKVCARFPINGLKVKESKEIISCFTLITSLDVARSKNAVCPDAIIFGFFKNEPMQLRPLPYLCENSVSSTSCSQT